MRETRFTFRLPVPERARLAVLAEQARVSEGALVREVVVRYAERTAAQLASERRSRLLAARATGGPAPRPSAEARDGAHRVVSGAPALDVAAAISRARGVPVGTVEDWIRNGAVSADGALVAARHWPVEDEGSIRVRGRGL